MLAIGTVFVVPSFYSFHFMSFMDAKLVGLLAGMTALSVVAAGERTWRRDRMLLFAPLFGLICWGTLVAFVRGAESFTGSGDGVAGQYWVVLMAAFLVLGVLPARAVQRALALSAVPVSILALAQFAGLLPGMFPEYPEYGQRMYSVFGNQDLLGGYVAIGLVLAYALWLQRALHPALAGVLLICGAPTLLLSGSRSAWLAAAVGIVFSVALSPAARRRAVLPAAVAAVIAVLAAVLYPGATWDRITGTFAHADTGYRIRLWIWDGTLRLIGDHPIAGVGLGNLAYHSPRALGEALHARGPGVHVFNHVHTQHAHSDLLEIAADTGAIGLIFVAIFAMQIPRRASPAWPPLVAAFVFSLVNTTLHAPAHLLAVLLLAGSVHDDDPAPLVQPSAGLWTRIRLVGVAAGVGVLTTADSLYASALYARARNLFERSDPRMEAAYVRASTMSANAGAAAELATLHANAGRYSEAIAEANSATHGLDTGDLYYLRAYLTEKLAQPDSADLYRQCLLRWPDHAPAYAGLLRNSPQEQRDAILNEAERWLSPEAFAALSSQASGPVPR